MPRHQRRTKKFFFCQVDKHQSPEKSVAPVNRKTSPLYTSVGSRKNLLELAGSSAESAILNTPVKVAAEKVGKFSVAGAMPNPSSSGQETRKSGYYQPGVMVIKTSSLSHLQWRHLS